MIDLVINKTPALVAWRGGGVGTMFIQILTYVFIYLCSYSIESFILNKLVWLESYELSFSQMLLGGVHTRVYVKNPKITVQNLPLPKVNSGY